MTVGEYMALRGRVALKAKECKCLGLPYPLVKGWKSTPLTCSLADVDALLIKANAGPPLRGLPKKTRRKIEKINNDLRKGAKLLAGKTRRGLPSLREQQSSDDFYKSPEWLALRYRVLATYQRKCMCCGRTPDETGSSLHVDHIIPRSLDRHKELDFNNCQLLCRDCNLGKSNRDTTDWRPTQP